MKKLFIIGICFVLSIQMSFADLSVIFQEQETKEEFILKITGVQGGSEQEFIEAFLEKAYDCGEFSILHRSNKKSETVYTRKIHTPGIIRSGDVQYNLLSNRATFDSASLEVNKLTQCIKISLADSIIDSELIGFSKTDDRWSVGLTIMMSGALVGVITFGTVTGMFASIMRSRQH